jgi:hypothetical protein
MGGFFKINRGSYNGRWNILTFTSSTIWKVPSHVTSLEVFAVGGGGGAAATETYGGDPGNGGNGGQVVCMSVFVSPGDSLAITIGAGGDEFTNGGDTSLGSLVTAKGGHYGRISILPQPVVNGSAVGGHGGNIGAAGADGTENLFGPAGKKYGAGGGGGRNVSEYTVLPSAGGTTGGGKGGGGTNNSPANNGGDATFYGGGGGGGAACSGTDYGKGGKGSQGILVIKY